VLERASGAMFLNEKPPMSMIGGKCACFRAEMVRVSRHLPPTQEEYDAFMVGFRLGFPCAGDPPATIENAGNEHFRKGLQAGMKDFKRVPQELLDEQGRLKN
jgi:hypothetical protein